MSLRKLFLALMAGLLLSSSAALAGDRWLHVRVDEDGPDGDKVRLQLPLNLIEAMLPLIETDEFHDGRVWLGDAEIDGAQLTEMLAAVRDAADGEYVRIKDEDADITVAKRNAYLHVEVKEDHGWDDGSHVQVKVPMAVVEAMITEYDDELDILAGIRALSAEDDLELVSVEDEETRVRIWIDDQQAEL